jgi:putative transposase
MQRTISLTSLLSHVKKDGSWYLIVVYEPWRDPDPPTPVKFYLDDIVALDPGVRTFQTLYSENTHGKMGDQFCETRLKTLNDRIDDLTSKISKAKGKTRYNMRRRCNKLRTKVTNAVLDLHRKTASFLVKSYNVILIPSFETKKMASKKNRVLSKGTVRNMNQLSHYAFKQRLMQRSERCNREFDPSGRWDISKVLECSEAFTSKTCGQCGAVKKNLKSNKVYRCNL